MPTIVNKTTISSVGQAFQSELHEVVSRPIEVVFTEKFRGLTADTTVYFGIVEVTKRLLNFMNYAAHGTESQEVGMGCI